MTTSSPVLILSPRALAILRAAVIDDAGRLVLAGPPKSKPMYKEITTALTAMGWRWNQKAKAFDPRPDPHAALAAALATGEVEL